MIIRRLKRQGAEAAGTSSPPVTETSSTAYPLSLIFDGDRSPGDRVPVFNGGDCGGERRWGERGHEPGLEPPLELAREPPCKAARAPG